MDTGNAAVVDAVVLDDDVSVAGEIRIMSTEVVVAECTDGSGGIRYPAPC